MIGDGLTDIEAGHAGGRRSIFIGRWKPEYETFIHPPSLRPTFVATDLWQAAKMIEAEVKEATPARVNAESLPVLQLAYD